MAKNQSGLIIFVAVLASLLEIIDTSIVNVALPTMMGSLGATLEDISVIITGYAIANAVILPLSAWLGDRFGRRRYYLGCIILFTATSVACGLAPNLFSLTICRILQGLAGGALLPTSQTLIYEQFPKEKAGIAGAIFGMSVMIGPTLGPVLGGYLTDQFGWRSIFNINLPLGILALFIGITCIFDRHEDGVVVERSKDKGFDAIGLSLLVLGIGCLQFVLERGEADDWFSSTAIIINSILAAVCIPSFIFWELKVSNPVINVRLFKERIVFCGISLMGLLGFFLYGLVLMLPIFVGRSLHYTATQTGALFIPGSLLTAAVMPFVGKSMAKGVNPKILIFIGLASVEVCMYMLTLFSPQTSKTEILMMLFVRGFAMAFLFVPINSGILSQFKGKSMGQVSGLLNLFRQIGGSIGVATVATLLSVRGQQNYLDIVSNISLLNRSTQSMFYQTVAGMSGKMASMVGMAVPYKAALQGLLYRVQAQVFMMSFIQLIWIMMFVFALAFIPWALIHFKSRPTGPIDSH